MGCYNPKYAIPYPYGHPKYGQLHILGYARNFSREYVNYGGVDPNTGELIELMQIPCKKCIGCRLEKSKDWAGRIMLEQTYYPDNAHFVTLTYDDGDLPVSFADGSDSVKRLGDVRASESDGARAVLYKKDLQDWFKRLRRTIEYNYDDPMHLMYFACGEYGPKTLRPHFHVCLFGLPGDDLQEHGRNKLGNMLYTSGLVEETWQHGFAPIGINNFKTSAYTARYVQKKANGLDNDYFDELGMPREFQVQSNRPALGRRYYEEHKDEIYRFDQIVLPAQNKDEKNVIPVPAYFDILYDAENPKRMAEVKALRRERGELNYDLVLSKTDLHELDYLALQESRANERVKKLIRDL